MNNTIYSSDVQRHIAAGIEHICETCPAKLSPDMIDLCAECTLTGAKTPEPPRDTRDYMK